MATRRIKDITNTATTFASDDFIALDGSTQGTRKMDKDDLIAEVSAGVSGDYLEEANNLSDVASLDTSKLNMEIPDVGTAPNEVPLNGMLGDMAYQSSDGVSAAKLEVESTTGTATTEAFKVTDGTDTNLVVREDGKVGLGGTPTVQLEVFNDSSAIARLSAGTNASASLRLKNDAHEWDVNCQTNDNFAIYSQTSAAERLVIDASSGNVGIGSAPAINLGGGLSVDGGSGYVNLNLVKGSSGTGHAVDFSDENGALQFRVGTNFSSGGSNLIFARGTGATIAWKIDSATGNLVANGTAIDFGSVSTSAGDGTGTTGTVDNSLLADYEVGSWTPTFASASATFSYTTQSGRYVKVGKQVTAQFYLLATASGTTSNAIKINGLPFVASAASGTGFDQFAAAAWFTGSNAIQWLTTSNTAEMLGWAQNSGPITRTAANVSGQYVVGTITYEATT